MVGEEHISDELLIAYAAGELNEGESAGVAAHLATCADCASTVARFKTVREFVHHDVTVEPPPDIVARAQAIFRHLPYEQLIGYAAGELVAGESASLAAHLVTCADCAATVTRFRAVRQIVRGDFSRDPPPATITRAQAIFRRHRTAPQPSRSGTGWLESLFPKVRPLVAGTLALLLLACLLALGQTGVGSSQAAIPGDTLYAVKLDAETAQIALSLDPVGKAQLLLGLTEKRVDEMVALNANGRDTLIPQTATRYENMTNQVMAIVSQLARAGDTRVVGLGAAAETILSRNIGILTTLSDKVTEQVRSAIGHAIGVSQNDRSAILNSVATVNTTPTPTPALISTQAPGPGSIPTRTNLPAAQTLVPAGQTPVPVGLTPIPPTQSQPTVAPPATNAPPTATPVPPSPTNAPPSATPVPPSPTNAPPGQTKTPPGQATKIVRTPGATHQ